MGETLAFLGLGVMGFPMAGHLQKQGHTVCVWNRTAEKAKRWVDAYGGVAADSAALAAADARVVLCCLGNDDDVRAVLEGPTGALSAMGRDTLLVDHTTTSANLAVELDAAARQRGVGFLDAPVSGGQAGAENGALTVMVGGEAAHFERATPLMENYARCVRHMGPAGSGQKTKMVNQICIAGVLQGLAEGLAFARAAGLDPAAVVDVISKGAAQSWQMENRHETMIAGEFDFGFAVEWMRKDLGFALAEARRNGTPLPLTSLVDEFYAEVEALGGKRWDTSSLIARLTPEDAS